MGESKSSTKITTGIFQPKWLVYLLVFIFLLSIANFVIHTLVPALKLESYDFNVYYDYSLYESPKMFDTSQPRFVYLPIWAVIFKPLTLFTPTTAKNIWILSNVLFLAILIYLGQKWCNKINRPIHPFLYPTLITFLVLTFTPLSLTLKYGQINIVILLLLFYSLYAFQEGKSVHSGIALALAISTRYTPVIFLLYWLLKREYKLVFITLGTLGILLIYSLATIGIQAHLDYLTLLNHYSAYVKQNYNYFGNFSIYSFLCNIREHGWLSPHFPAFKSYIIFALILVTLAGYTTNIKTKRKSDIDALEYGLWCVLLPLLSYYTEIHHFIFPLIAFIICVGLWNSIHGNTFKLFLFLGWLMIFMSFQVHDLIPEAHRTFILDYIDLLGTIWTSLVMLWLLWKIKKTKSYERTE